MRRYSIQSDSPTLFAEAEAKGLALELYSDEHDSWSYHAEPLTECSVYWTITVRDETGEKVGSL